MQWNATYKTDKHTLPATRKHWTPSSHSIRWQTRISRFGHRPPISLYMPRLMPPAKRCPAHADSHPLSRCVAVGHPFPCDRQAVADAVTEIGAARKPLHRWKLFTINFTRYTIFSMYVLCFCFFTYTWDLWLSDRLQCHWMNVENASVENQPVPASHCDCDCEQASGCHLLAVAHLGPCENYLMYFEACRRKQCLFIEVEEYSSKISDKFA